jgi:hypothetical protein
MKKNMARSDSKRQFLEAGYHSKKSAVHKRQNPIPSCQSMIRRLPGSLVDTDHHHLVKKFEHHLE